MKRVAIAAVLVVAMIFGVIAYATAAPPNDVVITAQVNPAFSFSITGPTAITLAADPITTKVANGASAIQVKSNKKWDFARTVAYSDAAITPFMFDTATPTFGELGRGVTPIATAYKLDFSLDEAAALALPAGDYTATYTYSAVQNNNP